MASESDQDIRLYNTRDEIAREDYPNINTPRKESKPYPGKKRDNGHYGHSETDTRHLISKGAIYDEDSDGRRESEDSEYRDRRYPNGGTVMNYNGDSDRNGYASDGGPSRTIDVVRRDRGRGRDRDRDRDTGRDKSREMVRAAAVYERSYLKLKEEKTPSVRKRHYDHMHIEDALQDKVATQLRENGVAETRVPVLSAKIAQAVRDDVIDASQGTSPQASQQLREAIHNHLDPILYNKKNVTDLGVNQKASDAPHLANIVLLRLGQVHEETESCKQSVEGLLKTSRRGHTPREDSDRSMLLQIKDGIEQQKTENDILQEKLKKALREHNDVEDDKERQQREAEELSAENWQLARDLKEAESDRESLIAKVKEQQIDYDRLDRAYMELKAENFKMKKQLEDGDTNNHSLSTELARLNADKARLQVLLDQKEKEILHLRDPDKEMVHNLRILQDEVTLLRTQTRRLNEEKGLLRSRCQRMESSLDDSHKARNKLTVERDGLVKENQNLRQRYRRVALATPQTRALPDIMAGKNGPTLSRTTSRATSRAYRSSQEEKERRMSPARENEESQQQ
ncbi:hypothetical protein PoB_003234000 [Plakobranchus ocellatus]|uniref:Uncharacterized protein n=1 Tax=Plakobranchus ocellatus TaxID=259542 RepID=A0AAV4AGF2_9GAST|nr:hypothetical protein PoB_003234000 [Plakobranchus ocellatus]